MEFTIVETLIMTYSPLLVTIIGIIIAFIKLISAIKSIKEDNAKSIEEKERQINELLSVNKQLLTSNYSNSALINELLTEITRIKRGEPKDESNTEV